MGRLAEKQAESEYEFSNELLAKPHWFVKKGFAVDGPIALESLEMLVDSGEISTDSEVWTVENETPVKLVNISFNRDQIKRFYKEAEQKKQKIEKSEKPQQDDRKWWYQIGNETYGPVSVEQLKNLIRERKVPNNSQVRFTGLSGWVPLKTGIDVMKGFVKHDTLISKQATIHEITKATASEVFYRNYEKTRGPLSIEDFISILEGEDFEMDDEVWFDSNTGWITIQDWLPTIEPGHAIHEIVREKEMKQYLPDEAESEVVRSQCPNCMEMRTVEKDKLRSWQICSNCRESYMIREYVPAKKKNRYFQKWAEVMGVMAFPFRVLDFICFHVLGIGRSSADSFLKNGVVFMIAGLFCFFYFWFADPTKLDSPDRIFEEIELLGGGMVLILIGMVMWAAPRV